MIRLDTAARQGVEPALLDLVKIRASQLNHCAFCLDMHSKDALAAGESAERIIQLRRVGGVEALLHGEGDRGDRADRGDHRAHGRIRPGRGVREGREASSTRPSWPSLIVAITTINAWNRFGVSTRLVPGHYTPGA